MILTCNKCGKTYNFPDGGLKGLVYAGGSHSLLPIGQRLECDGTLQTMTSLPSAEINFREIAKRLAS